MAENNSNTLGRKIFFLHPSSLIKNQIITELTQEEYEVYSSKDEVKLRQVLKKFQDSVVFINLNDGLKPGAWEEWIKAVIAEPETSKVDLGAITSADTADFRKKFAEQFKFRCGYTVIKSDLSAAIKSLVAVLESIGAKGRRKYLRALTGSDANTTVNLPVNGTFINGSIRDISTVGFSCTFSEDPGFAKNSLVSDIQIRLATQLIKAEGIVFGSRIEGEQKVYVILLSQRTSPDVKTRIRKFIQFFLQMKMDAEFK